jgi:thymidylate synthase
MNIKEHIGEQTVIDMKHPFVQCDIRNVSDSFRFAEAYWILSGDNRVETIAPYAPSIEKFSDNSIIFQGAYGPKVSEQLTYICETLEHDLASRQAVLTIWREQPRKSADIPCTVSLQFIIRNGELNCIANMRSSDIWLGWVYDVFNFSCISEWVRSYLGSIGFELDLGQLFLNMGSSHIYDRNIDKANQCANTTFVGKDRELPKMSSPMELMQWLKNERDSAHEDK